MEEYIFNRKLSNNISIMIPSYNFIDVDKKERNIKLTRIINFATCYKERFFVTTSFLKNQLTLHNSLA